jgi:ABC-type spermidine/putrescine transport system permease subunit II
VAVESINYECCLSFLMGIPVAYLLNRMPQKLARPEFMITVAFISTAIVLALDLLAVLALSGPGYLQDIDWTLTAQLAVRDFLACLVIGSILWKNRGPPEEKKTYVT